MLLKMAGYGHMRTYAHTHILARTYRAPAVNMLTYADVC
jgi:hypothetical protein